MKKKATSTIAAAQPNMVLALTVGGAPRPLAMSIASTRPRRVLFFASPESARSITDVGTAPKGPGDRDTRGILQALADMGAPLDKGAWRVVHVPAQDLLPCVEGMWRALAEELDSAGEDARVILDFTGGTKLMSAALALAGQRFAGARYGYVAARRGSASRDKGGLGVTVDGEEHRLIQDNPRDASAHVMIDDARLLCRAGAWGSAARLLEEHRLRLTDPARRREVEAWVHLCSAYDAWHRLHHGEALKALTNALKAKERINAHLTRVESATLLPILENHRDRLTTLLDEEDTAALVLDLVANADRHAANGQRDEAAQRVYRAVELHGRALLWQGYNIDPSRVEFDRLPKGFVEEHELGRPRPGKSIQLGLQMVWELLSHLGEEDVERFGELKLKAAAEPRGGVLALRNNSILVHGTHRTKPKEWSDLRYRAGRLLQIDEGSLVQFPKI